MRLRLPRVLPTYLLLALVIVFAIVSAWLGLTRLDAIIGLEQASTRSAETAHTLQELRNAALDIDIAGRGYALSGDGDDLVLYERARRDVPQLLAQLRDRVRNDPDELALVESLVPLIARVTALSRAAIEQRRGAPAQADAGIPGDGQTTEAIRGIITSLEAREQTQLARDSGTLAASIDAARRDRYLLASVIVLLAFLLFMAVRRLQSFLPPEPRVGGIKAPGAPAERPDARIALLLYDAMLRARLAASAHADSAAGERFRDLVAAIEHARLAAPVANVLPSGAELAPALAALARRYERTGGPTVRVIADQTVSIAERDPCLLVYRTAEWALEAIALRKHAGEIALHFAAEHGEATLGIVALHDKPDLALVLSPDEEDDVAMLERAAATLGGRLVVAHGVTGFSLLLALPLRA